MEVYKKEHRLTPSTQQMTMSSHKKICQKLQSNLHGNIASNVLVNVPILLQEEDKLQATIKADSRGEGQHKEPSE